MKTGTDFLRFSSAGGGGYTPSMSCPGNGAHRRNNKINQTDPPPSLSPRLLIALTDYNSRRVYFVQFLENSARAIAHMKHELHYSK